MSRQSPNRNQRSKGIKIKHVLQICLLVAICFWLIYQVKHSHDRKKEFDKSDEKVLIRKESTDGMIKLGRKDTHSQVEEIVSRNAEHYDELEEEGGGEEEEEEDKNEEDVQGEKNIRGNKNEGLRGEEEEEEETDEQERERLETEIDREEDFVDEEEGQDGDDKENEEKYSEDMKKDISHVEDVDGDGDDRSSHEAREEHYKADDASSAVTHDTHIDREKLSEHLDLVLVKKNKELINEVTNRFESIKELGVENGQMAKEINGSDVTSTETLLGYSKNGSFSNNTMTEEVTNSSTEVTLGNHSSSLGNITERVSGAASMDVGEGKNEIFDSKMPQTFEQVQNVFSDTSNSLEDKDVPANLDTPRHGIWNRGTLTKDATAE